MLTSNKCVCETNKIPLLIRLPCVAWENQNVRDINTLYRNCASSTCRTCYTHWMCALFSQIERVRENNRPPTIRAGHRTHGLVRLIAIQWFRRTFWTICNHSPAHSGISCEHMQILSAIWFAFSFDLLCLCMFNTFNWFGVGCLRPSHAHGAAHSYARIPEHKYNIEWSHIIIHSHTHTHYFHLAACFAYTKPMTRAAIGRGRTTRFTK